MNRGTEKKKLFIQNQPKHGRCVQSKTGNCSFYHLPSPPALGLGNCFSASHLVVFHRKLESTKNQTDWQQTCFPFINYRNLFCYSQKENFLIIMDGRIFAPIILKWWCIFLNFHSGCLHLVIFWGGKKLKWVPLLIIYVLYLHNSCTTAPLNTSSRPRPILKSLLLYETDKYDSQYSPHSFPQASWDVM